MRELHAQNRRLQRVEPEVPADRVVVIFHFSAMLPNRAHLRASPASRVVTSPASPNVRGSSWERTRSIRSLPSPPTILSRYSSRWPGPHPRRRAPTCASAISAIASMSALCPNRCTGHDGFGPRRDGRFDTLASMLNVPHRCRQTPGARPASRRCPPSRRTKTASSPLRRPGRYRAPSTPPAVHPFPPRRRSRADVQTRPARARAPRPPAPDKLLRIAYTRHRFEHLGAHRRNCALRSSCATSSVVPGYVVDSRMTSCPLRRTAAVASIALTT